MPLQFPSNPTLNQTYSSGSSSTYLWNGSFWQISAPNLTNIVVQSASYAERVAWVQATPPPTTSGSMWYDIDTGNTYIKYDAAWVPVQSNTVNATTASFALTSATKQYISARRATSDQSGVGLNTNLVFNSNLISSGISLNTTTGVFSLTANKVYHINCSIEFDVFSNGTGGFMLMQWVDSSTNTDIGLNAFHCFSQNGNFASSPASSMTGIYRPTTNQTIVLRVIGANGTANFRATSGVTIFEL